MVLRGIKKVLGVNKNGEPTGPYDSMTIEDMKELEEKELREKQAGEELQELREKSNMKNNKKSYSK